MFRSGWRRWWQRWRRIARKVMYGCYIFFLFAHAPPPPSCSATATNIVPARFAVRPPEIRAADVRKHTNGIAYHRIAFTHRTHTEQVESRCVWMRIDVRCCCCCCCCQTECGKFYGKPISSILRTNTNMHMHTSRSLVASLDGFVHS